MKPMEHSKRLVWRAPDHIKEEKPVDWFWVVSIVTAGIVILAIYFNNLPFALVILLAVFVSFMLAHTPPREVEYEINRRGVRVDHVVYTYANLESFYVIDEDGYERDRIILKSRKLFMPFIIIPIENQVGHDEVRNFLLEYLNEEEMGESTAYKIMHHLGF